MKLNFNIFKKSFFQILSNDNILDKKSINNKKIKIKNNLIKIPNILYDSGWLDLVAIQGTLSSSNISLSYYQYTAKKGQKTPFLLSYDFTNILNISENFLPFIKSLVLIKKYPEVTTNGIIEFQRWKYGDNHWKIYGDTIKIYQGIYPNKTIFSEEERVNGDFLTDNISKWYYGTLGYTQDFDSYELKNSYITYVNTYYNVVESGEYPGMYSYEYFSTNAIDTISSSSVIGQGTHVVVTVSEIGTYIINTTKNVQMTAPLFEDTTQISASGLFYKNGDYQYHYSDTSPLSIIFQGTFGGFCILNNFSYSWNNQWKLFWSNKRATQFRFNTSSRIPENLPEKYLYETDTLPYTKIYIDENYTQEFPELDLDSANYFTASSDKNIWTKIKDNQYCLHLFGSVYLSAPANYEASTYVEFVDEDYIQSDDEYIRENENRDDQTRPLYEPRAEGLQVRCMLFFDNPLNYDNTMKVNK